MKKIKIDLETECWLWQASLTAQGYGRFKHGKRDRKAHQVSYELFKGPIPQGKEPDHTCRVRPCANPDHLEAVTHRVNLLRGETIVAAKAAQTNCIHGHLFDDENIYRRKNGARGCRTCQTITKRRWNENNRKRKRELDRRRYARRMP